MAVGGRLLEILLTLRSLPDEASSEVMGACRSEGFDGTCLSGVDDAQGRLVFTATSLWLLAEVVNKVYELHLASGCDLLGLLAHLHC